MIAAYDGNYNLVSQLIMLGADVSLVDAEDRTALHWACSSMRLDLRIIQDLSISCNIQSPTKLSGSDVIVAKGTVVTKQSCIHARDTAGRTPFLVVLDQMSQTFLEKRPQPNDLLIAARMLLDVGADINSANYLGQTSLMLAARRQIYHAVAFLIESGADIERKDLTGCTALCHASDWSSWTIYLGWSLAKISSKKKLDVRTKNCCCCCLLFVVAVAVVVVVVVVVVIFVSCLLCFQLDLVETNWVLLCFAILLPTRFKFKKLWSSTVLMKLKRNVQRSCQHVFMVKEKDSSQRLRAAVSPSH